MAMPSTIPMVYVTGNTKAIPMDEVIPGTAPKKMPKMDPIRIKRIATGFAMAEKPTPNIENIYLSLPRNFRNDSAAESF